MDVAILRPGDRLSIKGTAYEVLQIWRDAVPDEPRTSFRDLITMHLHEIGSVSLHPTHVLWHCPHDKEMVLCEVRQDEPPKMESLKTRGNAFSCHNETRISIDDIRR